MNLKRIADSKQSKKKVKDSEEPKLHWLQDDEKLEAVGFDAGFAPEEGWALESAPECIAHIEADTYSIIDSSNITHFGTPESLQEISEELEEMGWDGDPIPVKSGYYSYDDNYPENPWEEIPKEDYDRLIESGAYSN